MTHRIILTACLILTVLILTTPAGARSYQNRQGDVITSLNDSVKVNWTSGFAYVSVSVDVPAVDRKRASTAFDIPGSLSEARSLAREKARRLAEDRLMDQLYNLKVDGKNRLQSVLSESQPAKEGFSRMRRMLHTRSRRTSEGYVTVELAMDLYGYRGLSSVLPSLESAAVPAMTPLLPEDSDRITSVIVVVDSASFEPALRPALYSDTGRMLYGPGTLPGNLRRPAVLYFKSVNEAKNSGVAGDRPYIVYASDIMSGSDVIIDSADARRIVGASTGREALSASKVLFVLPGKSND